MTEPDQPLSRRDRRAMEEQAGAPSASGPDAIPTHKPDGTPLSRRERRALERANSPVETWTAHEEAAATGQIPAMTPEVIAQQERMERERAMKSQREAEAVSQELNLVTRADTSPTRLREIQEGADALAREARNPTPRSGAIPQVAATGATPAWDSIVERPAAPAWMNDMYGGAPAAPAPAPAQEPQPQESFPPPVPAPRDSEPLSAPPQGWIGGDQPTSAEIPTGTQQSASAEIPTSAQIPTSAEQQVSPYASQPPQEAPADTGSIPQQFLNMFPPNSLQAKAMRAQFEAEQAAQVQQSGEIAAPASQPDPSAVISRTPVPGEEGAPSLPFSGEMPSFADSEPVPAQDQGTPTTEGQEELARLAELAEREAQGGEQPQQASQFGQADQFEGFAQHSQFQPPDMSQPQPDQTQVPQYDQNAPQWPQMESQPSAPANPFAPVAQEQTGQFATPQLETPQPGTPQPGNPQYEAQRAAPTEQFAPISGQIPTQSGQFPVVPYPSSGGIPVQSGQIPTQSGQIPTQSGQIPTQSGQFPVTTGSIEVPRREVPELHEGGSMRDLSWFHLAVIGAVAFALGIVVWNVAGMGS